MLYKVVAMVTQLSYDITTMVDRFVGYSHRPRPHSCHVCDSSLSGTVTDHAHITVTCVTVHCQVQSQTRPHNWQIQ